MKKICIISPQFFFQYCQPAQNQPKSHFLFYKNVSLGDFYIMTLIGTMSSDSPPLNCFRITDLMGKHTMKVKTENKKI